MRKPTTWTITDDITGATVTGDAITLAEVLPTWYPEAPAEVLDAVAELVDTLSADSGPIDGYEAYLDVTVERV